MLSIRHSIYEKHESLYTAELIGMNAYFLQHLLGYGSNVKYVESLMDLTTMDYARRIAAVILSLEAAISLFLLRKIAVMIFLAMFCVETVFIIYSITVNNTPFASIRSLAVPGLLTWYAIHLNRRGILT